MIISIQGSVNSSGLLIYDIPNIYFDRRYSYKVGVHHLYFELQPTPNNRLLADNELLCLSTNMVDLSAANSTQSIFHLSYDAKKKSIQHSKVNSIVFQALHLFELENVSFVIKRQFADQTLDIKNIFIQIEIIKIDPYGRV